MNYALFENIFGRINIPLAPLRLKAGTTTKNFDVYDEMRRKWVALTPEEWVRQHFVRYMSDTLGFSPTRIANEVTVNLNSMKLRADTLVYDDALNPLVVVEYKSPQTELTRSVLEQALRYNLTLKAKAVIVTNGRDVYSWINGSLKRGVITASDLKD